MAALGITFSLSLFFFLAAAGRDGEKEHQARTRDKGPAASTHDDAGKVSGHIEEANVGSFDLVDGLAYRGDSGVVVYVTAKPIASASLAGSTCPMTQARALSVLRNTSWAEVTLDARGRSPYFTYGTQYDGRSRASDPEGHYISTSLDEEAGRAAGRAKHSDYGGVKFDLVIHTPALAEPSQGERFDNRVWSAHPTTPTEANAVAAYQTLRRAALAKDLEAFLAPQGSPRRRSPPYARARHRGRPRPARRALLSPISRPTTGQLAPGYAHPPPSSPPTAALSTSTSWRLRDIWCWLGST